MLAAGGPALVSGCASAPPVPASTDVRALALLDRLTWGIDGTTLDAWNRTTRRDWLGAQLHPGAPPPLPADVQSQVDGLTLGAKPMTAWVVEMAQRRRAAEALADEDARALARREWQQDMNGLARDAATHMLLRAVHSPNQLQEQLAWFWFNHFNVHRRKADLRIMVGDYEGVLRMRALGRFRDLLIASATHPAMLRYLDNERNAAGRLNENHARELMELHTLGVDGGYTQQDVQELARVLTGLGVRLDGEPPRPDARRRALRERHDAAEFDPARHDAGAKSLLGLPIPAGGGWNEIVGQLARLAAHPATARHVSRRLAVYLLADEPPERVVDRMSRAWLGSDGDIAVTLAAMFASEEFTASLGGKFKDPLHYVVSAVRLAGGARSVAEVQPLLRWLDRLGQSPYDRQTPDGYPLEQAAWTGSGQMATRFEFARAVGSGSVAPARTGSAGTGRPPAALLASAPVRDRLFATLGEPTRRALAQAGSAAEWNTLLLASPEFMRR